MCKCTLSMDIRIVQHIKIKKSKLFVISYLCKLYILFVIVIFIYLLCTHYQRHNSYAKKYLAFLTTFRSNSPPFGTSGNCTSGYNIFNDIANSSKILSSAYSLTN